MSEKKKEINHGNVHISLSYVAQGPKSLVICANAKT